MKKSDFSVCESVAGLVNENTKQSPYKIRKTANLIYVENEYTSWCHDLSKGGELTEAIVKHGSNANIIATPQRTTLGIIEKDQYHQYSSARLPAESVRIKENVDLCELTFVQTPADSDGKTLQGVSIEHKVSYSPWGYGVHSVDLRCSEKIEEIGQMQVGTFGVKTSVDYCAIREQNVSTDSLRGFNPVRKWIPLTGGKTKNDMPVFLSHWAPLSVLMLERGMDGIEFCLGDKLGDWENIGRKKPGWQQTYIAYDKELSCYEVRICPLDAFFNGQFLEGNYHFEFRMALPHVREYILPLRQCRNAPYRENEFENRWPTESDIKDWQSSGLSMVRVHNDGDTFGNGIFWRDAAYPPYPDGEMKKMEKFLKDASDAGISVVPYFSMKEFHPDVDGFKENADKWMRLAETDGELIMNHTKHGVFGAQMCLKSNWKQKRKESIDKTLSSHNFSGMYYDWCCGYECFNPEHTADKMHHWDQSELQILLEWSRKRFAFDGELFLHLTATPNLAAENIATMIITEESGYAQLTPFMFTPHVSFLNIAPRQICNMLGSKKTDSDIRKLALCALLHHATVDSIDNNFYSEAPRDELTQYKRHSAPGEGKCFTSDNDAGISIYWNEKSILVFFANISEKPLTAEWRIDHNAMDLGWKNNKELKGVVTLDPLQFKTLRINKE